MEQKKTVGAVAVALCLFVAGCSIAIYGEYSTNKQKADAMVAISATEEAFTETTPETTVASTTTETSTESTSVTSRSSTSLTMTTETEQAETSALATTTAATVAETEEVSEKQLEETQTQTVNEAEEDYSEAEEVEEDDDSNAVQADEYKWDGPKLTKKAGILPASKSPSGYKETYYDLNMSRCLKNLGYSIDDMVVREDGVKTIDGYVMVASPNKSKHPYGSTIPTSLGMGIVVDYCPSGNLDICVTW